MVTMTLLFSGISSSYAIGTVGSIDQEQEFENDLAEAHKEVIVGYDRGIMETELEGNSMEDEIIQGLEVENLLISSKEVD